MSLTVEGSISGVYWVRHTPWHDDRGSFMRTFDVTDFEEFHSGFTVCQHNVSVLNGLGTVKGMHLQLSPSHEYKLVTCVSGSVADAIVDLRETSPSFGKFAVHELQAFDGRSLLIPPGVAHGMQNLEEVSIVLYAHTDFYNPALEGGINALDLSVGIAWPFTPKNLSARDRGLPTLEAFGSQHDL